MLYYKMIQEIENPSALDLQPPSFVCDRPLSKLIPSPFPNLHSFIVFTGASRSGKTSMIINMLTDRRLFNRVFENVLVICPPSSLKSMKKNIFDGLDEHKMFSDLDVESLENVLSQLEVYSEEGENSLLVLDDVTASLKDKRVQKLLSLIIANRRHLKCSIWVAMQWYNSMPLNLRKQINVLMMWAPKNFKEVRNIADEMTKYEQDDFKKIVDYCFDKRFNWMLIDRDNNAISKNWNRLEMIDHK